MPTIDVRDMKLYYEMTGEGDPALVLIHGMCSASWSWKEQVERLSPEFTCVAYDRRGHSGSEQGSDDHSDQTHTDDLAALIEILELDRPVLVIGGTDSPPFLRALNQVLVDHLPNARHVEVEDSGHVVLFEQPEAFAQAVRAFAQEVAATVSVA